MLKPFVPALSGVHRTACSALFRALLRDSRDSQSQQHTLISRRRLISKFFRRNARRCGHAAATKSLEIGYQALDLLRCNETRHLVLRYANEIDVSNSTTSYTAARPAVKSTLPLVNPKIPINRVPQRSILDRPHLNISGRRRVPVLVNANRFPFLRIKKPQPKSLTFYIVKSIKRRERRVHQLLKLDASIAEAATEDLWDDLVVKATSNKTVTMQHEDQWIDSPSRSHRDLVQQRIESNRKKADMARRLTEIVEKERLLYLAEEESRSRAADSSVEHP